MSEKTTYIGEVMSRAAWRHDYMAGKRQKRKRQEKTKNYGGILIDF